MNITVDIGKSHIRSQSTIQERVRSSLGDARTGARNSTSRSKAYCILTIGSWTQRSAYWVLEGQCRQVYWFSLSIACWRRFCKTVLPSLTSWTITDLCVYAGTVQVDVEVMFPVLDNEFSETTKEVQQKERARLERLKEWEEQRKKANCPPADNAVRKSTRSKCTQVFSLSLFFSSFFSSITLSAVCRGTLLVICIKAICTCRYELFANATTIRKCSTGTLPSIWFSFQLSELSLCLYGCALMRFGSCRPQWCHAL